MNHYSQNQHPDFLKDSKKWIDAWRAYNGTYATDHIHEYLYQKEQRETAEAYEERQKISDPVLHFPTAVDGLNGILFAKDGDTKREWGELGDPDDPDSTAYTLKRNADGDGTDWNPLMKQVGIRLTVMHKVWGLVEGVTTETDEQGDTIRTLKEGSIKIINPQAVVNWYPETGNPRQVLVKEKYDARTSIRDDADQDQDVYVLYELEGWTRYRVEEFEDQNGEMQTREIILGSGAYEYYGDTDRDVRVLPIFPVEIPMPRHVGHLLAKKQEHIYNKKSRRDFSVMNMSFAILRIVADKEQYDDIINNLEKGYNILRQDTEANGEHGFMSPDSTYLTEFGKILEKDKEDFYDAAFKQYGDAAKQVTATEVRLESRSGIEAFLTLLVTSIDEFENHCLWRLMQVYNSNPSSWGSAHVRRSRDFQPEDVDQMKKNLTDRYVGENAIPVDTETKANVILKILELDNIESNEETLERLKAVIENTISKDQADAVQRVETILPSEVLIRALKPTWDDDKVQEAVQKLREQTGAEPFPNDMIGA